MPHSLPTFLATPSVAARCMTLLLAFAATGSNARAAEPLPTLSFIEAWAPSAPTNLAPVSAIGVRGPDRPEPDAIRVVVLVDTSASQAGSHSHRAFEAVAGLLDASRPEDRFLVAAVDVDCVPLCEGFHPSHGEPIRRAMESLEARTPLGSTDFATILEAAADLFDASQTPRRIIYIGDGPALAAVDPREFSDVIARLRSDRISVSCIGIGPQVNWPCLAATANATGGSLLVPDATTSAKASGTRMAHQAAQHVSWPASALLTGSTPDLPMRTLPGWLPPLRADRDSVVLVYGPWDSGRLEILFNDGDQEDGPRSAVIELPKTEPSEENAYLVELTRNAWDTGGVFLPTLGREGLDLAQRTIRGEAATLAALSRQAQAVGATASALRLAEASLRRDPDNQDAAVIHEAALAQAGDPATGGDAAVVLPEAAEPVPPGEPVVPPAGDADELEAIAARRRVAAQLLEREIAVRIRDARQLLVNDPDRARDDLKTAMELVRQSEDLDAATRGRLERQLDSRIRESIIRSREKVDRDLAADRRAAIGRERMRLNAELQRREDRFVQLTERYNALVERGIRDGYAQPEYYPQAVGEESVIGVEPPTRNFLEAERIVGEEMLKEAPDLWANHPMPMTAREVARTAPLVASILHYDSQNYRTRRDRQRGFMDALHEADVAAIPFPTDPPIIYPTAERWRQISELRKKYKSVDLASPSSNDKKIYEALEERVSQTFDFQETPLRAALQQISDQFGIPIVPDEAALAADGISVDDTTVTLRLSNVRLRSALRLLLRQVDPPLTYLVKDEVLSITTKAGAEENLIVKVYPVADLVIPLNPSSGVNPFQTGGGLGGAGGINSGQGGGIGMGPGMGGAAGGLGGFCWLAREVYGAHDPRWLVFRQWMVEQAPRPLRWLYGTYGESAADWIRGRPLARAIVRLAMDRVVEPRLASSRAMAGQFQVAGARERLAARDALPGEAAPSPTLAATAGGPTVAAPQHDRIGLPDTVLSADDLRAALADYLPATGDDGEAAGDARQTEARLAQLRISAADLGKRGQFAKAAALIEAAIACGRAESWMYESLAVALEAAGRSRDDIERVLLSGADFASGPGDLLQLAHYLARSGSDRQAVRLCRRVTQIDPVNREAYALAMTVAARGGDEKALRWACPGVLSHEWPAGQRDVATRAARLARSTIDRLEKAGQTEEATRFQEAVDRALVRDLVVDVTWTGDADIDILVEEPAGTICSRTAPRSTSGGQLLADEDCAAAAGVSTGIASRVPCERYVAAEAFPGTYKILVRRVTGQVTADTITVEMTLFRGTDREQRLKRQVPVAADEQLLTVDVPWGRRQQPLLDAQVAQDVAVQQQIGRTVLARQLAAIADPAAIADLSESRGGLAETVSQPVQSGPALPFFGARGAVGYQPQISTLPEGVNLQAQAVISADRRYVRITATPLFSGIGQVTQFNFAGGGAQGSGQGGMGGGGMGGMGGMGGGGMGGMGGGGMGGMGGGGMGGMGGGGMGMMGMGGGGMGGGMGGGGIGICWVAREVYGHDNPRWLLFRTWLLSSQAPAWLRDLYIARGEAFAAWIHDKPEVKIVVRLLMDAAIESAAARVTLPCPASE